MKRTSVNPVDWDLAYSMNQGEIVEGEVDPIVTAT